MIEATVTQKFAFLRTNDEFVIVIGDKIHGPFKVSSARIIHGILEAMQNEKR
jgi:predicted metallopeptidase